MIRHLHESYGVRHILFVDDLFLASRVRVTEFCERLLASGLEMTWTCTARVDTVKPGVLALMKQGRLLGDQLRPRDGLERAAARDGQGRPRRAARESGALDHEAGHPHQGPVHARLPGRDDGDDRATQTFVRRIPMDIMNLTKFTPYPGSPDLPRMYGTKIRPDDWRRR